MKLFGCPVCSEVVFFENYVCVHCRAAIAYDPARDCFRSLPLESAAAPNLALSQVRACQNRSDHQACNWAVSDDDNDDHFCLACRLNEVIPDLSQITARQAWIRLEAAKRHLVYTLRQLNLPLVPRGENSPEGLAFAFKHDDPAGGKVLTGHANGVITINAAEADDASREMTRNKLGEPYRTLLGHFRHEVGHYYWERLVRETDYLGPFREVFGDERANYAEALQRQYEQGAPSDWAQHHISAYASSHPWEDWAETWAHYLHMVDGVETTRAYGMTLRPDAPPRQSRPALTVRRAMDDSFDAMLSTWIPVTIALNSFARGMGFNDVYPFALSDPAIAKLRFVHQVVTESGAANRPGHTVQPGETQTPMQAGH